MLNRESVTEKLIGLVGSLNLKSKDSIKPFDDIVSYGIDSLQFIQLIMLIESEFKIEIPDEKLVMSELNTIDKICNVILELKY